MKVFVTGATGFVGEEILRQLYAEGHSIRVLARNPASESARRLARLYGAEIHGGDVLAVASLPSAIAGSDAIIHLVGIISELGESTFERVHTQGTRNMLLTAQTAGVKRFIHMSALGTRPDAVSRYHRSKWQAEEIVRAGGMDFTIFRPSLIHGRGDHFVNLFAKIARRSPIIPVIGGGQGKMQPILVQDVSKCFVAALQTPESVGGTIDLCGNDRLTLEEIINAILKVTGRRRLKIRVPKLIANAQAALLEFVYPRLLRKASPLNRDQIIMLAEQNVGDPTPARKLFGLQSSSFETEIAGYLA
jgi:NADH dehydrogenase